MPRSMKVMIVIFAVIVGGLFMWLAAPAQAMPMCGKRADFVIALDNKYDESRKVLAIAGQVNLVEIFTSEKGTWTILITTPKGITCIIGAGDSWEDVPPTIKGKDS